MLLTCEHSDGEWQSNEAEDEKQYQCFCGKLYPSHSAVYLHLKYKHTEILGKHLLDQVARGFRKAGKIGSKRIYRLHLPSDNPSVGMYGKEQKHNDELRRNNSQLYTFGEMPHTQLEKRKSCPQLKAKEGMKRNSHDDDFFYPFDCTTHSRHKHPSRPQIIEIIDADQDSQEREMKKIGTNSPVTKIPTHSYSPLMYPYQPTLPNHYRTNIEGEDFPFYPNKSILSFREVLQQCLSEMQDNSPEAGESYQMILYDLMTYIDANHRTINDPRVGPKILLSYCSTFSGQLLNPLINQYTRQSAHKNNPHLNHIRNWLNTNNSTTPSLPL